MKDEKKVTPMELLFSNLSNIFMEYLSGYSSMYMIDNLSSSNKQENCKLAKTTVTFSPQEDQLAFTVTTHTYANTCTHSQTHYFFQLNPSCSQKIKVCLSLLLFLSLSVYASSPQRA